MKHTRRIPAATGCAVLVGLMVLGGGACNDAGEQGSATTQAGTTLKYRVVDTNQSICYDAAVEVEPPAPSAAFFSQDAQYEGNRPDYTVSEDGLTVADEVTGLTWQRSADTNGDGSIDASDKLTFAEAQNYPQALNAKKFGGVEDWRLPSIKELYSLIQFSGIDVDPEATDSGMANPFIDTDFFGFAYGDVAAGERIIDAQYASSTKYVSTTMDGSETMFGVNFADGRIKGYPTLTGPAGAPMTYFVICVRGNADYGKNSFADNGDGTVTDAATGLMWSQADSGEGFNWENALAWVQAKNGDNYLGHDDWRLPNAKELESIVDYARSPDATDSAAIDPLFECGQITNEAGQPDYAYYWTSTTHVGRSGGDAAVYVAFGRAMGFMRGKWMDVHGAGSQRSDPKEGDPTAYPIGRGPQGDAIRILNYVRLVRDAR